MADITVRKMSFEFSDEMDLVFIENDPALSFVFLGSWMLLPYLEPFLMRTMRVALDEVDDEGLRADMKHFCSQEGQHYRQHAIANEKIMAQMPSAPREVLKAKLAEVEEEFRAFFQERPLKWCLAYAEGFEAYTASGARAQLELRIFDYMKDPIRDLMLWHIMEEMEHRTVAFDAYEAVVGDYLYRLRVGLWAQSHFISRGAELAKILESAFPQLFEKYNNPQAIAFARRNRNAYLRRALRRILPIYLPWYSPHKLVLPPMYAEARAEYDQRAAQLAHQ